MKPPTESMITSTAPLAVNPQLSVASKVNVTVWPERGLIDVLLDNDSTPEHIKI